MQDGAQTPGGAVVLGALVRSLGRESASSVCQAEL